MPTVINDNCFSGANIYKLGEIYYFRNPTLKKGFDICDGRLIEEIDTKYPQIYKFLQSEEGSLLCCTEEEYQSMHTAQWGDGIFKDSWNSIGGVAYFVLDLINNTLRLPDLRGMFVCSSGDDSYAPQLGKSIGDRIRNIRGTFFIQGGGTATADNGAFTINYHQPSITSTVAATKQGTMTFDPSRIVPTGTVTTPRCWGALACVYLGA